LILQAISALILIICVSASGENRIPGYADQYNFVRPNSIGDGGKRMAIVNDEQNPLRVGQEMHVMRGDDIIGMFYVTNVGRLNVYGNFYSPIRDILLTNKDDVAIPRPESLQPRLENTSLARILFNSLAPDGRIWAVIDRGAKDGVEFGQTAAVLLDGRVVGVFKTIFVGKRISYGLIDREAIVSINVVDSLIVDFSRKDMIFEKPANWK